MARAVCLIGVPCIIYMACFQIHFAMLPLSGGGSSFMSPEFQSSLQGINFPKTTPAGSEIQFCLRVTVTDIVL
jgi:dolichyl-phosphate-mannose-protein mannosyltransferase